MLLDSVIVVSGVSSEIDGGYETVSSFIWNDYQVIVSLSSGSLKDQDGYDSLRLSVEEEEEEEEGELSSDSVELLGG